MQACSCHAITLVIYSLRLIYSLSPSLSLAPLGIVQLHTYTIDNTTTDISVYVFIVFVFCCYVYVWAIKKYKYIYMGEREKVDEPIYLFMYSFVYFLFVLQYYSITAHKRILLKTCLAFRIETQVDHSHLRARLCRPSPHAQLALLEFAWCLAHRDRAAQCWFEPRRLGWYV